MKGRGLFVEVNSNFSSELIWVWNGPMQLQSAMKGAVSREDGVLAGEGDERGRDQRAVHVDLVSVYEGDKSEGEASAVRVNLVMRDVMH